MSTVKISQLPEIPGGLNANTSNSLFLGVDIPTGITGKFTATQLAERLYANNVLNVGDNPIVFPNVAAQFAGDSEEYLQVNLQNSTANGTADYVITADTGTDTTYYVDLGINNSNYGTGALDGYLVIAGDTSGDPGGNLMVGSITSGKQIEFVIGGFEAANVVARMIDDTGFRLTKKPIIFADGTSQNTAAESASFSQEAFATANVAGANTVAINTLATAAYNRANTASGNTVALQAQMTTTNTNVVSVNTYAHMTSFTANSAYNKANNALANTTGTFNGALTVANDLTINGVVKIANTGFAATQAALAISASNNALMQTPAADGYMIHVSGKNGVPTRIISDSFGANGQICFPSYVGRAARGNVANPSAVQSGDVLVRLAGSSFGTTTYQVGGTARIDIVATENHTDTARGTAIKMYNIENGTNVIDNIATFNANNVTFTGAVVPQKGFIYTPNVQSTLTTLTLDFSRDSLIKFNVTADASITLSNFVYGKVTEVWITNSAAQNKVITHGCFANNSTSHATTFTIQAQSCAYLKYFSIDGDLANTFVSITA